MLNKMKNKRLKKNLSYNIIYQVVIVFLPLVISPYLSRTLGAEVSGIYTYKYSIAHYFFIFAMLGISTYGNRLIASVRDNKEELNRSFWSLFYFHLIISLFIVILYICYSIFIVHENRIITFILLIYILSSVFDVTWFFFGLEEFKTTVLRNILVKSVNFICIFIFVKAKEDLWKYTLIMSLGYFLSQIIIWPFVFKHVSYVRVTKAEILQHLKPNLKLFLPVIAISIFTYMDKIMLGMYCPKSEVAFYDYSEKIIDIPKGIIRAMGVVMLPTTTNMLVNGMQEKSKVMLQKTLFYVLIITIPILFGLASVSSVFAPLYFGQEFLKTGQLIALLCPALLFSVWGNVIRTQYLIPSHKDKEYILSLFCGAFVNLILNLYLIKRLGATGAVIGTIGAEFIVCLIQTYYSRKYINFINIIKSVVPFIVSGFLMYLLVNYLKMFMDISIISLFIEVIFGIIAYVLILIPMLFLLNKSCFMEIKKVIKYLLKKSYS